MSRVDWATLSCVIDRIYTFPCFQNSYCHRSFSNAESRKQPLDIYTPYCHQVLSWHCTRVFHWLLSFFYSVRIFLNTIWGCHSAVIVRHSDAVLTKVQHAVAIHTCVLKRRYHWVVALHRCFPLVIYHTWALVSRLEGVTVRKSSLNSYETIAYLLAYEDCVHFLIFTNVDSAVISSLWYLISSVAVRSVSRFENKTELLYYMFTFY